MASARRKIKSTFEKVQDSLDAYRADKSAERKSGAKVVYVDKNIYLTPANKARLKVWAARMKTTRNELINAILWDELLNKPKSAK